MLWLTPTFILLPLCAHAITPLPIKLLFQTADGSALENLAVRSSSELLITSTASPTLLTFDPAAKNPTFTDVVTFPNANGLLGIGEIRPDVFAVVASEINVTSLSTAPGSVFIWTVDFTVGAAPKATRAASIPKAGLANGLSAVPGNPDVVLVADSTLGLTWEANVRTGAVRVFLQDEAMTPIGTSGPAPALGINGLHVRDGELFFTNTQRRTFSRVAPSGGAVQQLGTGEFDDFTLDEEGRAWLATSLPTSPGGLTLIDPLTNEERIVVNTTLNAPSSAAFGRVGALETETLFITTKAGQLVSVDTSAEGV
ncbi:hypothetical protein FB45DRAFT_1126637 [Roridomyces roridus]|uniref:SMP-30/Gluconolactonase/LRE-like region domain-containing protein n=1 Tax=Roridomyces roridus TaxID=1738132 RepID=A0AAD7FTN0_9AGAR|nr:hypothetical protein FB45DRAFT_1126637 [Roridomyces roridus]